MCVKRSRTKLRPRLLLHSSWPKNKAKTKQNKNCILNANTKLRRPFRAGLAPYVQMYLGPDEENRNEIECESMSWNCCVKCCCFGCCSHSHTHNNIKIVLGWPLSVWHGLFLALIYLKHFEQRLDCCTCCGAYESRATSDINLSLSLSLYLPLWRNLFMFLMTHDATHLNHAPKRYANELCARLNVSR